VYDEPEFHVPRTRNRAASVFGTIFISALTSVAVFFGLREAERRGLLGQEEIVMVDVPDIAGMTVSQAGALLQSKGLLFNLEAERYIPGQPAGTIGSQAPLPGSQVQQGAAVRAVVSQGGTEIPSLVGLVAAEAETKLKAAGLAVSPVSTVASESIEAGRVIGIEPAAGAQVAPGSAVQLVISSGPAAVEVPKVKGLRISRAREAIVAAGFKVGAVRWSYSDFFDGSVVLKQSPKAGKKVDPGASIDLVVNEPD